MNTNSMDYDLIIAGGGMVGSALACALGQSDLKIALLEGLPLERIRPGDNLDARVSAISRASQRIFAAVGAWDGMTAWRVSPFREMRVWDATGSGQIHFDSATIGEPLLGWIIENRVIQHALLERARQLPTVDLLCPAALEAVQALDNNCWRVQLNDERVFTTRLLVGADGAQSKVRQWANIDTGGWNYDQSAVVANVRSTESHQETAWQRFLPTGPLAFLPLHDGRCSIVWATAPEQADALLALDNAAFADALTAAFDRRLGTIVDVGPRAAFPLRLQHAHAYVKPGIALIGDAAHVVHPLAGQGVNLGLLDAATLAEVLLDAITTGHDIGSLRVLRRYERWRKGDNLLMMAMMDGFKRLFGASLPPVQLLRNLGLSLTNATGPLKNLIACRAMGLEGDLPRLARGVG
ncbi:UbiH/UbiF/VisC/COQ6 family ubiquinone biosynthesis hydroxylase [Candidatus Contendibacter odensensis]|uniref:Oxidoreductase with FAD/NAD(P)-binding domain n=1 Tax=Candidatus Contendobacter odensis Run_B_J11 TaxID=1400861 RepID=A0A7U7G935_9GAMM|nr:UbiH/UbiF/VisC/COQ6 family ubiquinone biosynthesis hydroxylase [Candidatus Contendobacter odensis]CDH43457.1 putative oxidoreductase with FAD/NAD(P)-binding domain [Candidatus Contendobacter odensis Run_B_J11]